MSKKILLSTVTAKDDFSKKYIFKTMNGDATFEASSFYRKELNRYDICISTSAGCNLGCKICECTYSSPSFERNLFAYEIIAQINILINDGIRYIDSDTIVLVVFMGNGDPLANINPIIKSIIETNNLYSKIVTRYGLSTIGVNLKSLDDIAILSINEGIEIRVQLSTLNIDDTIRKSIIPNSSSLSQLVEHLDRYACKTGSLIRYNFPMILGVNNSIDHLEKIVAFIMQNKKCRIVKLSTYNETSCQKYKACSDGNIIDAGNYLRGKGVEVELFFANRDNKLNAACGQLRCSKMLNFDKIVSIPSSNINFV
ncbi:MAG: hypothetical protein V1706_14035 [Pseudomonadota bacterium]